MKWGAKSKWVQSGWRSCMSRTAFVLYKRQSLCCVKAVVFLLSEGCVLAVGDLLSIAAVLLQGRCAAPSSSLMELLNQNSQLAVTRPGCARARPADWLLTVSTPYQEHGGMIRAFCSARDVNTKAASRFCQPRRKKSSEKLNIWEIDARYFYST